MCPCSLLLFVHIWKYFNFCTQCCLQHWVYKIWIKPGKHSLIRWSHAHTQHTCTSQLYHALPAPRAPYQHRFSPPHLYYFTNTNHSWGVDHGLSHDAALSWKNICPVPVYPNSPMLSQKLNLLPFTTQSCFLQGAGSAGYSYRET